MREGPSRWRWEVSTCREDVRTCREDVSTRWDDVSSRWDEVSTRTVDVSLWRVLSTRGAEDLLLRGEAILPVHLGQEGQRGPRTMLASHHTGKGDVSVVYYVRVGSRTRPKNREGFRHAPLDKCAHSRPEPHRWAGLLFP